MIFLNYSILSFFPCQLAQLKKSAFRPHNSGIVFDSNAEHYVRSEKVIFVLSILFRFIINNSTNNDDIKFLLKVMEHVIP